MLGKRKATVQFVAIALVMLRPDVLIGGMLPRSVGDDRGRGRHRVVGHRLLHELLLVASRAMREPRLRHGRQRRGRRRARREAGRGGDEVVGAGPLRPAADKLRGLGAEPARGELFDEDALAAAMAGCSVVYNVAGVNSLCSTTPSRCSRQHRGAAGGGARRGARRVGADRPHLLGGDDRRGVGHDRTRGHAAPRLVPVGLRALQDRGRAGGVRGRGGEHGVEVVCVNPSSVQGPGRAGGTARFLLAYLDGRLKVFVADEHQPHRHLRLRRGSRAGRGAGRARASATC